MSMVRPLCTSCRLSCLLPLWRRGAGHLIEQVSLMEKVLVFALIVEIMANGVVSDKNEYGVWRDVNDCVYFARALSLQFRDVRDFDIPIKAYCVPKFVDEDVEIF